MNNWIDLADNADELANAETDGYKREVLRQSAGRIRSTESYNRLHDQCITLIRERDSLQNKLKLIEFALTADRRNNGGSIDLPAILKLIEGAS